MDTGGTSLKTTDGGTTKEGLVTQLLAVQFSDDKEFLRCIEFLTTDLDPGAAVQVVAPRVIILPEAQAEGCKAQGIHFWQVVPVESLGELAPEEELKMRREHLAQFQRKVRVS